IDVLQSISRCMSQISTKEHKQLSGKVKSVLAVYQEAEDLINIGAYKQGSSAKIDDAISKIDTINQFLLQEVGEKITVEETLDMLRNIFGNDVD
ncbi:MAG: flagellum-specific ATP synthase FliI, partial [Eubacteriales bacterium]